MATWFIWKSLKDIGDKHLISYTVRGMEFTETTVLWMVLVFFIGFLSGRENQVVKQQKGRLVKRIERFQKDFKFLANYLCVARQVIISVFIKHLI